MTKEELLEMPYIVLSSPKGTAMPDGLWKRIPQILGATPAKVLEADGVNSADMMVACNMGYILFSEDLKEEYQANQFAYIPVEGITQGFPLWCVWRRNFPTRSWLIFWISAKTFYRKSLRRNDSPPSMFKL